MVLVLVRSHAERIAVLFNDEMVADDPRQFRRDQIIYDPWHYLPVLVSALLNGAPFMPAGLAEVRAKLKPQADADRQFVKLDGLKTNILIGPQSRGTMLVRWVNRFVHLLRLGGHPETSPS